MNLEFSFVGASNYFLTNNYLDLQQFFKYQANTLTLPYLGSKIVTYFNLDPLISQRALSLFGQIIILYSIILLTPKKSKRQWHLIMITSLTPFIYIFSLRGTADLFPASLGLLSYAIYTKYYLKNQKLKFLILSSFIFSIALIAKYHACLYLIIFALTIDGGYRKRVKEIFKFLILPFLVFYFFQIFLYKNFNFIFINPNFKNTHKLELSSFLSNFLTYVGFMYLFINLLIVDSDFLKKTIMLKNLITMITIFVISVIFVQNNGELNMPIKMLSTTILYKIVISISAALGIMHMKFNIKNKYTIFLLFGLALLSLSRPADRYLIFLFPFIFMLILNKDYNINYRYYLLIISFVFLNILIITKQYVHGVLCEDAINYLDKNEMILQTLPGDCFASHGNLFSRIIVDKKFIIRKNNPDMNTNKIYERKKNIGGYEQIISIEAL